MNSNHAQASLLLAMEQEQQISAFAELSPIALEMTTLNAIDESVVPTCGRGPGRSPCNSIFIMESLIAADKRYNRRWVYCALIIGIVLTLFSIGSFFWFKQTSHGSVLGAVPLLLGISMAMVAFVALVVSFVRCSVPVSKRNSNSCMTNHYTCLYVSSYTGTYKNMVDNILSTIHLDGEIWQLQIESIEQNVPTTVTGCLTRKNYRGLKKRSHGHILIAKKGLIIDELIVIAYERNVLLRIELLSSSAPAIVLRLHFVTRYYFKGAMCMDEPTKFEIDLFFPPSIPLEEVITIDNTIQLYSSIYLNATESYDY